MPIFQICTTIRQSSAGSFENSSFLKPLRCFPNGGKRRYSSERGSFSQALEPQGHRDACAPVIRLFVQRQIRDLVRGGPTLRGGGGFEFNFGVGLNPLHSQP